MFLKQTFKNFFLLLIFLIGFPVCYYCGTLLSKIWIDTEIIFIEQLHEIRSFIHNFDIHQRSHKKLTEDLKEAQKEINDLKKIIYLKNTEMSELKKIGDRLKFSDVTVRLTAKVLRVGRYRGHHSYVIGIPDSQSVEPYDLVLNEGVLIGRITQCGFRGAYVLSITDPHFRIPVVFKKSKIQAILCGNNSENLSILHTNDIKNKIIDGDEVVTSGSDGITLPGIFVGHVVVNQKGFSYVKIEKKVSSYFTVLKNIQSFF